MNATGASRSTETDAQIDHFGNPMWLVRRVMAPDARSALSDGHKQAGVLTGAIHDDSSGPPEEHGWHENSCHLRDALVRRPPRHVASNQPGRSTRLGRGVDRGRVASR